jgi:hypothetical protein
MSIPSDPDYIPAATDNRVLRSSIYLQLLSMNVDPYASPRDEGLIELIESYALLEGSIE